jgi:hypothetical protein
VRVHVSGADAASVTVDTVRGLPDLSAAAGDVDVVESGASAGGRVFEVALPSHDLAFALLQAPAAAGGGGAAIAAGAGGAAAAGIITRWLPALDVAARTWTEEQLRRRLANPISVLNADAVERKWTWDPVAFGRVWADATAPGSPPSAAQHLRRVAAVAALGASDARGYIAAAGSHHGLLPLVPTTTCHDVPPAVTPEQWGTRTKNAEVRALPRNPLQEVTDRPDRVALLVAVNGANPWADYECGRSGTLCDLACQSDVMASLDDRATRPRHDDDRPHARRGATTLPASGCLYTREVTLMREGADKGEWARA